MSLINKKRILVDIKNYKKSELENCGIYCHFNDENIHQCYAMIIGPKDTPYANGFYYFDINFTKNYPMEPPKVKFITYGKKIRFNPNLYVEGKVCLSILGTWNGPGWTSCCTLNTVLLSIQSLLHEHPIQNEPGWEKCSDERSTSYNKVIEYGNVCVASIDQIKKPPRGCEPFLPIMKSKLLENRNYYESYFKNNPIEEQIKSSIYSIYINTEYRFYETEFYKLIHDCEVLKPCVPLKEPEPILELEPKPQLALTRKVPEIPAPEFDLGTERLGGDGRIYIVKQTNKGNKRWNLKK